MCPIAWDDGTPAPSLPQIPIHNTPGRSFVRLLGPAVGVFVHWKFGRSLPCLGGACPHCREGLPSRWAGYAPAQLWKGKDDGGNPVWALVVLYVPENNREDFAQAVAGDVLSLERQPAKCGKPLRVAITERPKSPPPPAFDVRAILAKLWRYAEPRPEFVAPPDVPADDPPTLKFRRKKKGGAA